MGTLGILCQYHDARLSGAKQFCQFISNRSKLLKARSHVTAGGADPAPGPRGPGGVRQPLLFPPETCQTLKAKKMGAA